MNLQVIASPDGDVLWVSGALPGSVHDKNAEWIRGVLDELEAAGLVTLADKSYQGSAYAKIPYKGKNKPESQKQANKAHAKLRSPGERANAQLKTGSRPGTPSASSAAAPGAPDNSPRPSTFCRSARQTPDEKGSVPSPLQPVPRAVQLPSLAPPTLAAEGFVASPSGVSKSTPLRLRPLCRPSETHPHSLAATSA